MTQIKAVGMTEQRVRQSVCARCGKTVRSGSGIVPEYGAGGRVHAKECPVLAQQVIRTGLNSAGDEILRASDPAT
jgi:hypothetical protein